MSGVMKTLAMLVPPIRRVIEERDSLQGELGLLQKMRAESPVPAAEAAPVAADALNALPGTPYSRYAVPVEYLPSRDFNPRWGYSKPRIPSLNDWFARHAGDYHAFLKLMRGEIGGLAGIPMDFDEKNLPQPAWNGVPYCAFDALALYSMVKKHKPKRYLEIGSGITTCFAKKAVVDAKLSTHITSIDPEPRAKIDAICDTIIRDGLETCDLAIFDQLEAGDILFFDGSHRSFMNSDVTVFFIDVLPRLKPGVIVHIHDISLPWDYDHFFKNWYWNEQYLLAIYMMGNQHRIEPLLPTSFICRDAAFEAEFAVPMLDLGKSNDAWRGGGAMWFTHKA